jgi:hypothetical protein
VATVSIDLDPVDVHLRGYGHSGLPADGLVHTRALDRLLETFARHDVRATFFVLVRDEASEVARLPEIRAAGHEVASHGISHLPGISRLPPPDIRTELTDSRRLIEGIVGQPVTGFRAPDWSAGRRLISALAETGYRYDASLVPSPVLTAGRLMLAARAHSLRDGLAVRLPPSLRRTPFRWTVDGASIVEFPVSVTPRLRLPVYHTLRPRLTDASFEHHLDGFVARGESLSYALHGVDALGLVEDGVDARLRSHPGMSSSLDDKLGLLERTLAAIVARFVVRPFAERLAAEIQPMADR